MQAFDELGVGDFVHASGDSYALWGSFNMPTLSFESLHEIFHGFPFSLLDVVDLYQILDALLLLKMLPYLVMMFPHGNTFLERDPFFLNDGCGDSVRSRLILEKMLGFHLGLLDMLWERLDLSLLQKSFTSSVQDSEAALDAGLPEFFEETHLCTGPTDGANLLVLNMSRIWDGLRSLVGLNLQAHVRVVCVVVLGFTGHMEDYGDGIFEFERKMCLAKKKVGLHEYNYGYGHNLETLVYQTPRNLIDNPLGTTNGIEPVMNDGIQPVVNNQDTTTGPVSFATLLKDKRVAFSVGENYLKNEWSKDGLVRLMMATNGMLFFKFSLKDEMNSMLKNVLWLIRNVPLIIENYTPNANIMMKDVCNVPIWVKFHDISFIVFTKDGFSDIATKLDTLLILDSYATDMCLESWGRSNYTRAMIELRANVKLKDALVMDIPKFEDGKLMVVDDDEKPLNKVDSDSVNLNSNSDVKVAYDDHSQIMASRGENDSSLYEDEDYDIYAKYDTKGLTKQKLAFYDMMDINLCEHSRR
uniref:DUF4283 domain-containing protein n=1 Tax=Tanacetum cinerariifolium TaxID=118510 RepID=A0A6L2K836_TANCI|nr:hypothetical protein [Tanacetum cinerariifolium]